MEILIDTAVKSLIFSAEKSRKPGGVVLGRHFYKGSGKSFVKTTIFIEKEIYNKLIDIRCDYFDRRSFKEIVNKALEEYLKKEL